MATQNPNLLVKVKTNSREYAVKLEKEYQPEKPSDIRGRAVWIDKDRNQKERVRILTFEDVEKIFPKLEDAHISKFEPQEMESELYRKAIEKLH